MFSHVQDDDIKLKSLYKRLMQQVLFWVAPTMVFSGVLAEPLFRFLLTEKWLPAVPYFQILCYVGIMYPLHSYNLNVLKVKGRSDLFLKLEIIKKILEEVIIAVSIQYGIVGLIWGQWGSSVLAFFINIYYTGKFIRYTSLQQVWDLLPILLLACCCGAGVWFLDQYLGLPELLDILRLLLLGACGAILQFLPAY